MSSDQISMTIEQARQARIAVERRIADTINRFEVATGIRIDSVQLHRIDMTRLDDERPSGALVGVTCDSKL